MAFQQDCKTEIKEIYVYSLVSLTDRDLLLKENSILPMACFLSAVKYHERKVISSQLIDRVVEPYAC